MMGLFHITSNASFNVTKLAVFLLFIALFFHMTEGGPRCRGMPEGGWPDPPPGACPYGIHENYCGRKVCAKGPGDVCGTGLFQMLGSCGDGMFCQCGRCLGCSGTTMECFDMTCI